MDLSLRSFSFVLVCWPLLITKGDEQTLFVTESAPIIDKPLFLDLPSILSGTKFPREMDQPPVVQRPRPRTVPDATDASLRITVPDEFPFGVQETLNRANHFKHNQGPRGECSRYACRVYLPLIKIINSDVEL